MTVVADVDFRCPSDLIVNELKLHRVLIIGSCLAEGLPAGIKHAVGECSIDYMLFNYVGTLPETLPHPASEYDFQVVQIPLRSVLPDMALSRLRYDDLAACENLFQDATERVRLFLAHAMKWNVEHNIPTFVYNFLTPHQNALGRLLPRYDLRNPLCFIERLNETLARELENYKSAYLFDFDRVIDTYGRRYYSDDVTTALNHAASFGDWSHEFDTARLEPVEPITNYYPVNGAISAAAVAELLSMYRTLRRADEVKLVVVDIDDTLWRGIAAEETEPNPPRAIEGWPLGVVEALGFLKQRGMLLAIASKNDEKRLTSLWQTIIGGHRLSLDDFAVRKINWRPKIENFDEILAETNLLPKNVLYIDDNPVERAAIKAAYPDVRVLGPNPYLWRRILLWSSEMQVAQITAESTKRTEMVQAQVRREEQRQIMSREEFLSSLDLRVTVTAIETSNHPLLGRAVELVNKTNQFNTTGRRWSQAEVTSFFATGGRFYTFDAQDKFTAYGTIGVVMVKNRVFEQFVMSCRVVGMDVELAAIGAIIDAERAEEEASISAEFEPTEANVLCRDLYARAGFDACHDKWRLDSRVAPPFPAHIAIDTVLPQSQAA